MKTIYVFDDFSGDTPVHMGNLYVDVIKGGESYSFEYTEEWLKQNKGSVINSASIKLSLFSPEYVEITFFKRSMVVGDKNGMAIVTDILSCLLVVISVFFYMCRKRRKFRKISGNLFCDITVSTS